MNITKEKRGKTKEGIIYSLLTFPQLVQVCVASWIFITSLQMRVSVMFKKMWKVYVWLGLLESYFPVIKLKISFEMIKHQAVNQQILRGLNLFSLLSQFLWFFLSFLVYRVVEFASYSDMKSALEKLDGTELNGRRIKLIEDHRRHRYVSWLDKILLRVWIWVVLMPKLYYLILWSRAKYHSKEALSSSINRLGKIWLAKNRLNRMR